MLLKIKSYGRDTARLAPIGDDRLAPLPSEDTFAAVVGDASKMLATSAMQAHCSTRGDVLHIFAINLVFSVHAGIEITRLPFGGILLTQDRAIVLLLICPSSLIYLLILLGIKLMLWIVHRILP